MGHDRRRDHGAFFDAFLCVFGSFLGRGSSNLSTAEAWWSTVEALIIVRGVGVITLSLALILRVVQAFVHMRTVASQIGALGTSTDQMLPKARNGNNFEELHPFFTNLVAGITLVTRHHLAYPVIHCFHVGDLSTVIGPRLVSLDETLTVIDIDDLEDRGLYRSSVAALSTSLSDLCDSFEQALVVAASDPPPVAPAGCLVDDGLLTLSADDREACCEDLADRRRFLLGYLEQDGWDWKKSPARRTLSTPPTPTPKLTRD